MKLPDQISVESTEMIFNDHDTNISLAKKKKKKAWYSGNSYEQSQIPNSEANSTNHSKGNLHKSPIDKDTRITNNYRLHQEADYR